MSYLRIPLDLQMMAEMYGIPLSTYNMCALFFFWLDFALQIFLLLECNYVVQQHAHVHSYLALCLLYIFFYFWSIHIFIIFRPNGLRN